jgi:O-antigen/teichoic acid export membrane protein
MRTHLSNAAYSVLDYIAQPIVLLLATPILLHQLGLALYGLWLIASAIAGGGGAVSSGFGDAIVQRVASLKAAGNTEAIHRVVGTMLAINLALGTVIAAALWLFLPTISSRIVHHDPALYSTCLWSLRIASVLIVIKAIESVLISAQKAYQSYGPAVRIALITRVMTILACIGLALTGRGLVTLMLASAAVSILGAAGQYAAVRHHLGPSTVRLAFDRTTSRQLLAFGSFTWLQTIAGVIFSQADRLLLGATLGPSAVAFYGISVQLALPIHGLTAAGLHALFPYLASHVATTRPAALSRPVLTAFGANVISAIVLTAAVIVLGPTILVRWMGTSFAAQSSGLLPLIALGFGLLALNVTAHYTLMALGHFRIVTIMNVAGGMFMLLAMAALVPSHGVKGAAIARLCYGPITCLLYLPLLKLLRKTSPAQLSIAQTQAEPI